MVLHLKNYVFAIQKHWFYQKIPDFSCQEKTRYHYNLLLTKKLWKALQNSRISRPMTVRIQHRRYESLKYGFSMTISCSRTTRLHQFVNNLKNGSDTLPCILGVHYCFICFAFANQKTTTRLADTYRPAPKMIVNKCKK